MVEQSLGSRYSVQRTVCKVRTEGPRTEPGEVATLWA